MTVPITSLPPTPGMDSLPDAGLGALRTDNGNLPLDEVDVHVSITGSLAGVEVTQGFRNPFDTPLEATYIFPLPDRAALTAMRMEAADRVVDGVLKERGRARAEYAAAVAEGRRAAIAEEDRPDVFSMRVGNILPGERVRVRLALSQPLPYEGGELTYRFPLVVAPRYIPGTPLDGAAVGAGVAPDTDAVPDASRITPPVLLPGFPSPVRLGIRVDVDPAGLSLSRIASSLHTVVEEPASGSGSAGEAADGRERATTLRVEPGERLDRDFILRLTVADEDTVTTSLVLSPDPASAAEDGDASSAAGAAATGAHSAAEPSVEEPSAGVSAAAESSAEAPAEGTFTLTVLPLRELSPPRPRDLVLVLDRSGSMSGWKIVAARRAAARIIDTLNARDRFAVLAFDHEIAWPADLPHGLVAATDRHRFRAIEHLAAMTARGGTGMLTPLDLAAGLLAPKEAPEADSAAERRDGERDRVLVLVTDGQVGNEDQILAGLAGRLDGVRVHTVGIDRAVNAGFLGRLAAAGRGRCELVESEDRLDAVMERIHRRIAAPVITGLRVEGDGIVPGTVTPHRPADVFPGAALRIAGRWRGDTPPESLVLRGTTGDGGTWERRVRGTVRVHPAATSVWARAFVRELEDRYAAGQAPPTDYLSAPPAGDDLAGDGGKRQRAQIVAASLRFGVMCRFTAFVAVDGRVVTDGGTPHQVVQPVEYPSGWEFPAAHGAGATWQEAAAPAGPPAGGPVMAQPMGAMPAGFGQGAAPAPAGPPSGPPPRLRRPAPPRPRGEAAGHGGPVAGARPGDGMPRIVPPAVPPVPPGTAGVPAAPTGGPPGPADSSAVADARAQLVEELAALRAVERERTDADRLRFLADLGSRLRALVVYLTTEGVDERDFPGWAELTALVADLEACDDAAAPRGTALQRLWDRTEEVLAACTADREG